MRIAKALDVPYGKRQGGMLFYTTVNAEKILIGAKLMRYGRISPIGVALAQEMIKKRRQDAIQDATYGKRRVYAACSTHDVLLREPVSLISHWVPSYRKHLRPWVGPNPVTD